jgi:hypothetical protein
MTDAKKLMISARVSLSAVRRLRELAVRNNVAYTSLVEAAIKEFVEEHANSVLTRTKRQIIPSAIVATKPRKKKKREI